MDKKYALISHFFDVEQSASCAHIGFPQILDSVNDGGANSECDTVIIRLADTSNSGDVGPLKDVLSRIYNKPWVRCVACEIARADEPDIPFSVMTRSGLNSSMRLHCAMTCSSSISCARAQSLSLENSMFV